MFGGSRRGGTVLPVSFGRADLPGVYMSVRAATAVAVGVIAAGFSLFGSRSDMWVVSVIAVPVVMDTVMRRTHRGPDDSMAMPLLIDCTAVGVLITISGLAPVAIAYSLLAFVGASILLEGRQLGIALAFVGVWMGTALIVASRLDPASAWTPLEALWFTFLTVAVAMAAVGTLVAIIMHRLRRVEMERNRLLGGFAHDIKNALTGAIGMAELLGSHLDDFAHDEIVTYAQMVVREGQEAVAMTDDLLAVKRAEAGSLDVVSEVVDVPVEVARVLEARGESDVVAVEVRSTTSEALADPVRVRQILRNLLSNAERYGGDQVRVSVRESRDTIAIEVADSGPAIAEEDRERMFRAYERAGSSRRVGESVGLGLTISRHLAQLMRGDLSYRHDGWSVFELTLPKAVVTSGASVPPSTALDTGVERVWLAADGILRSRVHEDAAIGLDDARDGVEAYRRVGGGVRRPILVYAEDVAFLSTEARAYFTKSDAAESCLTAIALLVTSSPTARAIASTASRLSGGLPVRLFEDEESALAWLRSHRPGSETTGERALATDRS